MKWHPSLRPRQHLAHAAQRALASRLRRVRSLMKAVGDADEPQMEDVHQLRVGARRAVAALRLYRDVVPRKQRKKWSRILRQLRDAAGEIRDADVMRMYFEQQRDQPFLPFVLEKLATTRCRGIRRLQQHIEKLRRGGEWKKRWRKLRRKLAKARADAPSSLPRVGDWAQSQWQRCRDRFVAMTPTENSDWRELHRLRVAAKKLRYTVELLVTVLPPHVRADGYPVLVNMQEELGQMHDAVQRAACCEQWSRQATDTVVASALRNAAQAEWHVAAGLRRRFVEQWPRRCRQLTGPHDDDSSK